MNGCEVMKRIIATLLIISFNFVFLCGCKGANNGGSNIDSNADTYNSLSEKNTESNTDNTQLYMQFLNGEIVHNIIIIMV